MPRFESPPAGHDRELRALVATADHALAAWACAQLPSAGVTACEEAADAEHAVALADASRPDLCLLDVALPGGALPALQGIQAGSPATRVVMLAPAPDDPALLPAVHAGASGCLVGTPDAAALERVVRDVLAGHAAIPRALLTQLVAGLRPA